MSEDMYVWAWLAVLAFIIGGFLAAIRVRVWLNARSFDAVAYREELE